MDKIILPLFVISFVLTNAYAAQSNAEIYCPTTHIAVDGKCQPVNYINPFYWVLLITLIPVILIIIFVFKSKIKSTKN